jgi:hypothetical protein
MFLWTNSLSHLRLDCRLHPSADIHVRTLLPKKSAPGIKYYGAHNTSGSTIEKFAAAQQTAGFTIDCTLAAGARILRLAREQEIQSANAATCR